jgi:IBR domain, a half RING-finger domain
MARSVPRQAETVSREFYGAAVHFGAGAEIPYIKLHSDTLTIRLTNLPAEVTRLDLAKVLQPLGFPYSGSNILIHGRTDSSASSEIQLEDHYMAELLCQSLDKTCLENHRISAELLRNDMIPYTASSRLKITSVACSWHKPSRVAWANYVNAGEAEQAVQDVNGRHLNGRDLQCCVQPPRIRRDRRWLFPVFVRNLSPEITRDQLLPLFRSAFEIVLGRSSYAASPDIVADRVRAVLTKAGELVSFDVRDSANTRYSKATATYSTPLHAKSAVQDLHDSAIPGLGSARLYIKQRASAEFLIKSEIYNVVGDDLAALRLHSRVIKHVLSRITKSGGPCPSFKLRIVGEDVQSVVKIRSAIEQTLAGTTAKDTSTHRPLWHDYFLRYEGLRYLAGLQETEGCSIETNSCKQELTVWASASTKQHIIQDLIAQVQWVSKRDTLDTTSQVSARIWQTIHGGFLATIMKIQESFGYLNIAGKHVTKALLGSDCDKPKAGVPSRLLVPNSTANDKTGGNISCAVCWVEPDEPWSPSCGHIYCLSCLERQCSQTSDSIQFPIQCLGDQGHCNHVFEIEELERALPTNVFDKLLESSFDKYVRQNPDKLKFCPTPDCSQIYRVFTESGEFSCPTCHQFTCTSCGTSSHEGLTCSEHKEWSAAGIIDFQKWMDENAFKPCPQCDTLIEKSDGCNHMTCRGCSTSFCWICLGIFDHDKIYDHMNTKHGNIGLEDENGDGYEDVVIRGAEG